jgi:hypothetical protein
MLVKSQARRAEVTERATDLKRARAHRFVEGLRERKLVQWLVGYLAVAWMALQLTDSLREIWNWPVGVPRAITLALGLGAFPAAVVAWYHGEKGRQQLCLCELLLLIGLTLGSAAMVWSACA